jgi:hypothetical protein
MDAVQKWGEALPEDWYHIRVAKVTEAPSKESGEPCAFMQLLVQEEPLVGASILDHCSLQPQALAKLKAYYIAIGKGILPNGHDPELLTDGECYVKVLHKQYKGETRMEIPPYGIRSLAEGKPAGQ